MMNAIAVLRNYGLAALVATALFACAPAQAQEVAPDDHRLQSSGRRKYRPFPLRH